MEKKYTQLATVPQTAARCKDERIGLSAGQLRSLVKSGQLRAIQLGRNQMIYWPALIRFLESGAADEEAESGALREEAELPEAGGGTEEC